MPQQLQVATNHYLNWLLQQKSNVLDHEPKFVFDTLRQVVEAATKLYPATEPQRYLKISPLTPVLVERQPTLGRLRKQFSSHRKLFVDVVLHGSAATNELIVNWSDVDIIAILRSSVLTNTTAFLAARNCLCQAEKVIYQFDPWQHHGIQVITEADMRFYPEYFMPLTVLERGASLLHHRSSRLGFSLRNSVIESRERFKKTVRLLQVAGRSGELHHHGRKGVYLKENFKNSEKTFYQFKYFVSIILLLPSLFLEVIEEPILKKDSFSRITRYCSEKELELVRACEAVRALAPRERMSQGAISKAMQVVLGNRYLERSSRLAQCLWKAYEAQ